MARRNYVDMDLYGRGFDGIFGYGAEEENKRQALMAFKAMQRFKERVKPGDYIDLDLYGRGDPRVFGPGAHIETQKCAQKLMEDAQQRKKEGHTNRHVIMFPAGLKAITDKARQLVRRASSKSPEQLDREAAYSSADEKKRSDEKEGIKDQNGPAAGRTQSKSETSEEPEYVDNTPRRVKSKLPSEEVPPYVAPGHVARALRSITSQDKINDDEILEPNRNELVAEPIRVTAQALNVPGRTFSSGASVSESSRSAGAPGALEPETVRDRDQPRHSGQPASARSEAEVARGILVESDEEFPLSFSQNVRDDVQNEYKSTSSEEDLLPRQPKQERILVDAVGRSDSRGGNKIAGLFRSGDSSSGSGEGGADGVARMDAGPSRIADNSSSSYGSEDSSEGFGEVLEVSQRAVERGESSPNHETPETSEEESPEPVLVAREASIVNVVDTGDLALESALQGDDNNDIGEMVGKKAINVETTETEAPQENMTLRAAEDETARVPEQVKDDIPSSSGSGGGSSNEGADYDDQDGSEFVLAENVESAAYVTDSDRSGEAGSSSEVISSSPEEDSDDVEIETSVEVEEESDEAEEVEEEEMEERSPMRSDVEMTEEYSAVRVVDSSDAGMTSDGSGDGEQDTRADMEANEGAADEGTEEDAAAPSFWQRLNLFGTIFQGSWTVY